LNIVAEGLKKEPYEARVEDFRFSVEK